MKCRLIIHRGKWSLEVCLGIKVLHSNSEVLKGVSGECDVLLAVKDVSK